MAAIKDNKNEWRYHPIVIFTEILLLYTAGSSIITLFNL